MSSKTYAVGFSAHVMHYRTVSLLLHNALASCGAMYCNRSCLCVGGWVCVYVCRWVCGWVCYHDNSKLRATILTKLGL